MRRLRAVLALGCCWLTGAQAQEPGEEQPGPDLDFLEYLGAWAEEDDEWLAIEEWERDNPTEPGSDEDRGEPERQKGDDDESE